MKKSVLFTSLLVLSSLALAACGGGSDDKGASNGGSNNQVYTMVESQEMPSADPSLATDEQWILPLLQNMPTCLNQ